MPCKYCPVREKKITNLFVTLESALFWAGHWLSPFLTFLQFVAENWLRHMVTSQVPTTPSINIPTTLAAPGLSAPRPRLPSSWLHLITSTWNRRRPAGLTFELLLTVLFITYWDKCATKHLLISPWCVHLGYNGERASTISPVWGPNAPESERCSSVKETILKIAQSGHRLSLRLSMCAPGDGLLVCVTVSSLSHIFLLLSCQQRWLRHYYRRTRQCSREWQILWILPTRFQR